MIIDLLRFRGPGNRARNAPDPGHRDDPTGRRVRPMVILKRYRSRVRPIVTFMRSIAASAGWKSGPGHALSILAAILAALIPLAEGVGAATVPWIDLEEMATQAEVIALGRVDKVESAWTPDGRMIVTTATIEIEKALKGGPWRRVSIRTPGGRVGDQIMVASGAPTFSEGERLIVFLERPGAGASGRYTAGADSAPAGAEPDASVSRGGPDRGRDVALETPFSIVGWNLGKMPVRRDTRTDRDLVHDPSRDSVTYVGPDGRPIDRARGRRGPEELGQFLRRVERILDVAAKGAAQ